MSKLHFRFLKKKKGDKNIDENNKAADVNQAVDLKKDAHLAPQIEIIPKENVILETENVHNQYCIEAFHNISSKKMENYINLKNHLQQDFQHESTDQLDEEKNRMIDQISHLIDEQIRLKLKIDDKKMSIAHLRRKIDNCNQMDPNVLDKENKLKEIINSKQ